MASAASCVENPACLLMLSVMTIAASDDRRRGRILYRGIDHLLQDGTAFAPETMAANLLARILRTAVADGADRREILSALHLDEARLRNPLSRIPADVATHFFRLLQKHFNDPSVHLRLGEKAAMRNFSDIGYVTQLETDLASVIKAHIQLQSIRQNIVKAHFDPTTRPPRFLWEYDARKSTQYAALVEFSVMSYARLARQVLAEPPLLRSVHFRHAPQFDVAIYAAAFGCPVSFEMPETRMEMAGRQVFRPSPYADPALFHAAYQRYREPVRWLQQGKALLARSYFYLTSEIDKSSPTLDSMAATFGMSERVLRRKLVAEGMSFRNLLERVRRDLSALYLMEGTRSIGEIAVLLGYGEISAFTRAHKRWNGVAPRGR